MRGKRVQFDDETWNALDLLARDRMQDFQELADEAFADLLRKHGRPTDLKTALRQSAANGAGVLEERSTAPSVRRGLEGHPEGLRPRPCEHHEARARSASSPFAAAPEFLDFLSRN
jgi:hypothetical protein